ncbi:hypothetical protein HDU76_013865 [Blyttiomyces sp. JEL0837]|nr:hypothetical protein HDU76_013865 [Blyttiomyces sp. JEL0837]
MEMETSRKWFTHAIKKSREAELDNVLELLDIDTDIDNYRESELYDFYVNFGTCCDAEEIAAKIFLQYQMILNHEDAIHAYWDDYQDQLDETVFDDKKLESTSEYDFEWIRHVKELVESEMFVDDMQELYLGEESDIEDVNEGYDWIQDMADYDSPIDYKIMKKTMIVTKLIGSNLWQVTMSATSPSSSPGSQTTSSPSILSHSSATNQNDNNVTPTLSEPSLPAQQYLQSTPSPPVPTIPPFLLPEIFQFLTDHAPAMKSASLTCHLWYQTIKPHLWTHLSLFTSESVHQLLKLSDSIISSSSPFKNSLHYNQDPLRYVKSILFSDTFHLSNLRDMKIQLVKRCVGLYKTGVFYRPEQLKVILDMVGVRGTHFNLRFLDLQDLISYQYNGMGGGGKGLLNLKETFSRFRNLKSLSAFWMDTFELKPEFFENVLKELPKLEVLRIWLKQSNAVGIWNVLLNQYGHDQYHQHQHQSATTLSTPISASSGIRRLWLSGDITALSKLSLLHDDTRKLSTIETLVLEVCDWEEYDESRLGLLNPFVNIILKFLPELKEFCIDIKQTNPNHFDMMELDFSHCGNLNSVLVSSYSGSPIFSNAGIPRFTTSTTTTSMAISPAPQSPFTYITHVSFTTQSVLDHLLLAPIHWWHRLESFHCILDEELSGDETIESPYVSDESSYYLGLSRNPKLKSRKRLEMLIPRLKNVKSLRHKLFYDDDSFLDVLKMVAVGLKRLVEFDVLAVWDFEDWDLVEAVEWFVKSVGCRSSSNNEGYLKYLEFRVDNTPPVHVYKYTSWYNFTELKRVDGNDRRFKEYVRVREVAVMNGVHFIHPIGERRRWDLDGRIF